MKMKIVVLFDANLENRKGLFNAIVSRTKNLMKVSDCIVDLICLQPRPGGLNRLFMRHTPKRYEKTLRIEGLTFNMMWYERYFIDNLLTNRLHKPPLLFKRWMKKNIAVLSSYDIISAHSTRCGEMARQANIKYGMPFFVTWHGTDIHTMPFLSSSQMDYVRSIIQQATCNFFVSKALWEVAKSFVSDIRGEVLYNGAGDGFVKYDEKKRKLLRTKYRIENTKVVAFVGNLIPIKNVALLPLIFNEVTRKTTLPVTYWIIGDGNQKQIIEKEMSDRNLNCVFWGNRPSSEMPDLMNCIDVLVLPSKNEGLPLVLVEALACGAEAVGSHVGGIPEVIGEDNSFELEDNFVSKIANRITYFLTNEFQKDEKKEFDWEETALKENYIYNLYRK